MKISKVLIIIKILFLSNSAYSYSEKEVRLTVKQIGGPEKFLKFLVESQAKNLPQQIDAETKVLSMFATDKTLYITHQMINVNSKEDIINEEVEKFKRFQRNKLCTSDVGKVLLNEFDIKYRYQYVSKSGQNLITFNVDKKDCK